MIHFTKLDLDNAIVRFLSFSERHADGGLVKPRKALARNALEIMVALLPSRAEAVWVSSRLGCHIGSPLQRVAVVSDPSGLFHEGFILLVFSFVTRFRVLERGITLKVMMLLLGIVNSRMCQIWVKQ